jgi:PAS domain S-box-containing protein
MDSWGKNKAIISFRDISTEVNLQEKLQESERGFLDLAENLDQIVYIFDFKTQKYKYISPIATKILGYHLDEFYESSWREIVYKNIHPQDTHLYRNLLSKIEKGLFDTPFLQVRFRMKRGDGEYAWLQDSMHPIYDVDGNLIRIEGIIKDVTEDKKYRIQLKSEIAHLEAELENMRLAQENNIPELIVHSIQDGIFFTNPAKKYLFVNQAFCDLVKSEKEDLINKNIMDVPIGENWDEIKKNLKEKCIGEEKNISFEQEIHFKDGDFAVLEFSCHKLKEKNSLINIGNVGIIRDVTEKNRSENRYKISQKIIEALVTQPIDKSFEQMIDYLKKGIQFDIFNIMLRKDQKENKILIIDDFSTSLHDQIEHGFQYEIDGTASQKVIESGAPIIVNDVAESGFATSTILLSHGVHSFLSYPLKRNGNVIATMNFHSYNKNNFSESDYEILGNISNVLTFILNNALERAEIKK